MKNSDLPAPNYDETRVRPFDLPDPLVVAGRPLSSATEWTERRRPEILNLFARHVYGRTPDLPFETTFTSLQQSDEIIPNCLLEEIELTVTTSRGKLKATILLALPSDSANPFPTFISLNFHGNQTAHPSPFITVTDKWVRAVESMETAGNRATEKSRGKSQSRWPFEEITARGYAVVMAYCGDFDPDFDDGFQNGAHPLFYRPGQTSPAPDEWGTIGAWSWGMSRMADYVESDSRLDPRRIISVGHSRLGKTALWAAARDPRFAMAISNNSGCVGASLSRRNFGETVEVINQNFPHWFCGDFKQYGGNEEALPLDQHMLLALIAPRPLYIASASGDLWADPRGEWISATEAAKVYSFLGHPCENLTKMPAPGEAVYGPVSYHLREGKHDITLWDWRHFMNAADRFLPSAGRKA